MSSRCQHYAVALSVTAMRLLVAESNVLDKDNEPLDSNPASESGINEADDCPMQSRDVLTPNIKVSNRFSSLAVDENNTGDATSEDQTPNKKKKTRKTKSKKKQTTNVADEQNFVDQTQLECEQRQPKTSVVVAGYSIIKYVKAWELSDAKMNVSVKSFSGATVDDMRDFLMPTTRRHPDKLVIHAGTNDARSSNPKTIADKITELAEQFKQK